MANNMKDLYAHLPHLYVFLMVVEQGSFQGAARQLDLPRSSVSKRVAQLEEQLGLRLLQRSTRQLSLTDEGRILLAAAQPLIPALQQMQRLSWSTQREVQGKVVISSATLPGERYLIPLLAALRQAYPQILVELRLSDQVVDLIADGVDLAIRVGNLPDSSLVARTVGRKHWGCFASPEYVQDKGMPECPQQLSEHDCLVFRSASHVLDFWSFADMGGEEFRLKMRESALADDGRTLVSMACAGMGIIRVDPAWIVAEREQGRLLEVLAGWRSAQTSPIHWLSLGPQARNPAVECVWQWLGTRLEKALLTARGA